MVKEITMTDIILKIIQIREQVQILHWQTKSYARHKAYDMYYEEVSELLDAIVESYQGKYERIKIVGGRGVIELQDIRDLDLNAFLEGIRHMLVAELPEVIDESDTDILNIRDEILALTNKLIYLLTLK